VSAFAIGIGVTVLAAWLPARRAARVAPVAAMSSVHTPPTTKSLVLRNTVGALIAGAGAATVLVATGMDGDAGRAPMALGAALLITGVFVLTPLLSRPLVAAAEPVLRLFGTPGRLARRNAVRNPRRTAATASALMIGLTLITGMTVAAASLQHSIDTMATAALRADYVVSMANGDQLDPSVGEDLAGADGVTRVSPMRDARTLVDGEHLHLTGVDGPAFARLTDLPLRDGAFTVDGAKVVVDADTAGDRGWRTGSAFTATLEDGTKQRLTVAGVYEPNEMFRGVLADVDTLTPHLEDPGDMIVLVATEGGASAAAEAGLVKALGKNPALRVQDKKDVSAEVAQAVTLLLNMVYGLLAMAVVIAVLGVVNTLAMSVFERSQEIGMLRAIGLDQRGVRRMVRLESVVISLLGGVLGVGLGVFFGWAAGELAATELSTYEMVLPWGRILLFLAGAAAVGVLAAVWPARRAARMNMLAAIKAE
jgi:putative ABC transport system permease protein